MNNNREKIEAIIGSDDFVKVDSEKHYIAVSDIPEIASKLLALFDNTELYETVKELLRRDEYGSIRLPTQATDMLQKALAKAEGK